MNTIYAKLLAGRGEYGEYTKYVFQNLETGEYILCTKFPNWNVPPIKVGTVGYLKYKEVIAGRETWYDPVNNIFIPYKFDLDQFIDFIEKPSVIDTIIV